MATCPLPDSTPTSVYRYYDDKGTLIYVGITGRGVSRNTEHNKDKNWWRWVSRQKVEHFETREEAHAREVEIIQQCRPPFNTHHNPCGSALAPIYVAARDEGVYQPEWFERRDDLTLVPMSETIKTPIQNVYQWWTGASQWPIVSELTYLHERRGAVLRNTDGMTTGHVSAIENHPELPNSKLVTCRVKQGWTLGGSPLMKVKHIKGVLTIAFVRVPIAEFR